MTIFQAILLGIIQGLTEFLPISSSAHLVLAPYLLGWHIPAQDEFVFDILVQVGTLVAVFAYFWQDLWAIARGFVAGVWHKQPFATSEACLGWYLILATLPAALIGLLIQDLVETAFNSPTVTALFLLGTAGLLILAESLGKRNRALESLKWKDALWIGFFQALALFPGISRSGATITGGILRHLDRRTAAHFSFLMAVPVMLAAGLFAISDLLRMPGYLSRVPALAAGFLTAAIVGYFSIRWLLGFLTRRSLYPFAAYCFCAGLAVLVMTLIR